MKINSEDYKIEEGEKVHLFGRPTRVKPAYKSRPQYEASLSKQVAELSKLQQLHYAANQHAVLLAGKDGAIKHVMSGINPQGCQVCSFQHPSAGELDHDFLWRTSQCLPERGRIGIFNRSYYEEVLIVRVHPEILRAQRLPNAVFDDKTIWKQRYQSILALEKHLHYNGTKVVKFFLHLSKEEQRKRFLARIDDPDKNWKFSSADIEERNCWPKYMQAYEACMSATSTATAPWYVVPADDKENAHLIIANIVLDTFRSLKSKYPQADATHQQDLRSIRKQLLLKK